MYIPIMQFLRTQSQSIISTVKRYRLRASQPHLSQRQSYFGIQPANNVLMDIFRSWLLTSVAHWQQWVSPHQRITVSKRQTNLFGLSLRLPYILVLTATCFSDCLSISLSMFLSLLGSWKKQESTSSVFRFATLGRQKELYTISCCRQYPRTCECCLGIPNEFCLPAFHLPASHPHWLSESVKYSGETRDINIAMENRHMKL